jgi:hypothetical protein
VKFDGDEPGPLSSEARIREWADGRDLICAGCRRWRSWRLAWAEVLERHSAPGDPLVPPLPREAASYLRLAGASPEAVAAARAAVEQWERDWPAKAKRGVQPGSYKKGLAPHAVRSTAEAE